MWIALTSRSYAACSRAMPGRLVDAAALGLDDPVLDLVRHAQAVAAADRVGLHHQVDGVANSLPLMVTGRPWSKPMVTSSVGISTDGVPEPDAHDRVDRLDAGVEVLQGLRLVRGAPDVGVGRVGLLGAVAVGQAVLEQPLRHLLAATQFGDEGGVEPRLVDAQLRVGQQAVAVEPLDVVALEGRAVAPDLHVVLEHRADQQGAGHGAAERGGVEVGPPAERMWNAPQVSAARPSSTSAARQSTRRAISAP